MSAIRKCLCLILCLAMSTYTLPVFAAASHAGEEILKMELTDDEMRLAVGAGNVDATMSEYIRFEPNTPPVAEAVVANRSLLTVPYALEVTDTNGAVLEELASGTLAPGETKIVSGTATVANKSTVRIRVGGVGNGLQAVDTAYLSTRR